MDKDQNDPLKQTNKQTKLQLINTLIHYCITNRNKNRTTTSYRIDQKIRDDFSHICERLGFARRYGGVGGAIEALMQWFSEEFKDHPQIVQTTLLYKPTLIQQNVQINIATKLELKLIKKDLTLILQSLENKQGDQSYLMSRLREVLPRAIKIHEKTNDNEVSSLLERTEKWV